MAVLAGVKVLEISGIGPAPWCGMLLADMGASIIRIERPSPAAAASSAMLRGRTVLHLDLKRADDLEKVRRLVAQADVLTEGMRPGAMERLGLGPDTCLALNPRLVYARMTGWGQEGPLAARAGHDINYIALTGALHAIGRKGEPPAIPLNLIGDYGGGGAFLAIGILAALLHARSSGQGQVIDAAMIDGAANLMALQYERHAAGRWKDARGENTLDSGVPWYDVYRTKDGKYMAVGAIEPQFYAELLRGLEIDEDTLPERADPQGWPLLRARFAEAFATRTRDEWDGIFADRDACVTPVLSLAEAPRHPHNVARRTFVSRNGAPVPNAAPRFSSSATALAGEGGEADDPGVFERWGVAADDFRDAGPGKT